MIAVCTVLVTLLVSLVMIRVAGVALTMTGLSRASARFQAHSAFNGVGFFTADSELIAKNPTRSKIVGWMMVLGKGALVAVIAASMAAVMQSDTSGTMLLRLGVMAAGGLFVFYLSNHRGFDEWLCDRIQSWLADHTDLELSDYSQLLHLGGDYGVTEVPLTEENHMTGRLIGNLDLEEEGVYILGVRNATGDFNGEPNREALLHPGDTLVVYGPRPSVELVCGTAEEAAVGA